MKKLGCQLALISALVITATSANASHHFEAAQFLMDTRVAQVDNYIFPSENQGYTAVIMTVNYDPKPGEDQTFNPNAVYNMHLAFNKELTEGKTFSIKFEGNTYHLYELDSPNAAPGTIGKHIGSSQIDKIEKINKDIKVYAGIVNDPFFGNSPSLGQYRKTFDEGKKYDPDVWKNAQGKNVFIGRKVGAISIDIANENLGKTIYVFFTTDLNENNEWKQVQYSAIPLLSHTMLMNSNMQKKVHDSSRPSKDYNEELKKVISSNILRALSLSDNKNVDPVSYADATASSLVPDVISYSVGTKASFGEQINGRKMDDDIMTVMLTKLFGKPTNQEIKDQKSHSKSFPYVVPVYNKK